MPAAATALRAAFPTVDWDSLRLDSGLARPDLVAPGAQIVPPGLLFQKLPPEQLAEWEARFDGGDDAAEASAAAPAATAADPGDPT